MLGRRLQRTIEKNQNEVAGLLLRRYPAFVLSDRATGVTGVPTFSFHDVTAASLEPALRFLAANGYRTLTADEYAEAAAGRAPAGRAVMLTFDDGLRSLYTVAFPLLRRYGLKAVAYVVPGLTPGDGDGGRAWGGVLCGWAELGEMHASGAVDIQSHSMYHHSVAVTDRVLDFVRPGLEPSFLTTDLSPIAWVGERLRAGHELDLGTPIFGWGPRYGGRRAYRPDDGAARACVAAVAARGGAAFFERAGWRRELRRAMAQASGAGAWESAAEQRAAILSDLVESKRLIERHLPGKTVRHFCFPWFRGSELAARLSAEAGYRSNAWGSLPPGYARARGMPLPVARLAPLYLWRLPGEGRRPIRTLLQRRMALLARRRGAHG